MTINELLSSRMYRGNQTLLSAELNISRNTVRKYMNDNEGKHHFVIVRNGDYHFYANLSDKVA